MKCDELKAYTLFTTSSLSGQRVYLTNDADATIAELKAEKAQAEDDVAYWKMQYENTKTSVKETEERCEELEQKLHDLSEHAMDVSGMTIDKVSELKAENAELKRKLHDAEMRADLAEAAETERKIDYDNLNKEHRQTLRALWRLRQYYNWNENCFLLSKGTPLTEKVKNYCRAKVDQFKEAE